MTSNWVDMARQSESTVGVMNGRDSPCIHADPKSRGSMLNCVGPPATWRVWHSSDGRPSAAGSKPCTGKLIVKNDFCTFDNTAPPAPPTPSPEPAAAAAPAPAKPAPAFMGCGDLKWPCCDIPDNDPNGGTCRDDTILTCWEGACKRCGTDGMPACAGATPAASSSAHP